MIQHFLQQVLGFSLEDLKGALQYVGPYYGMELNKKMATAVKRRQIVRLDANKVELSGRVLRVLGSRAWVHCLRAATLGNPLSLI